jgi:hypothetical protein
VRYDLKFYTLFERIPVPRQRDEFSVRFLVKEVAMRQVFLRVMSVFIVYIILPVLHTHLHLKFALVRRTKGRKVKTFIKGGSCGNWGALDRQSLPPFPPVFQNVKLLSVFICSVLRHVRISNRRF